MLAELLNGDAPVLENSLLAAFYGGRGEFLLKSIARTVPSVISIS